MPHVKHSDEQCSTMDHLWYIFIFSPHSAGRTRYLKTNDGPDIIIRTQDYISYSLGRLQ